jgi:Domain of unknown function (DUF4865)
VTIVYAKQYDITLPADYDMGILRARIADAGPVLDDRAGLGMKTWAIRERGVDGSPVNQFAAFYLWQDAGAMACFLVGGGGFESILRGFGRPAVDHWVGIATLAGPARDTTPRAASRRLTVVPADPDPDGTGMELTARIEREIKELETLAGRDGVHTAALAIDPRDWRLVRFALWQDTVPADEDTTERYELVHLSAPSLAALPNGRHW